MTPHFDAFVAPARGKPALWRLALGCVLMTAIIFGWLAIELGAVWTIGGGAVLESVMRGLMTPDTPGITLLLLATFIGMALAPMAAARWLHGRGVGTLIGPARRTLRDFGRAVVVVAGLYAVTILLLSAGRPPVQNLAPGVWLALLAPALVLVLIQTGAEELIFRGYLQQQIAARFPRRIAYLLVPSIVFGALHFDPTTAGANAALMALAAGAFGLAAADLTYATGSLGAAWGLHFANNVAALLIVATKGTITGLALYVTPYAADDIEVTAPLILADIASMVLIWAILRWWLRR